MAERKPNHIATANDWREASRLDRAARAERLELPSGAVVLAARPDPLEWLIAGRLPQRLLATALESSAGADSGAGHELTREEILDLARFAAQLVASSLVEPRVGDGPADISMEDIPVKDRAFIFEWACRALSGLTAAGDAPSASTEEVSSQPLERFRPE